MAKHLVLAVIALLCFTCARAQNAFDAAVLLYQFKKNKVTDSATMNKVARILGSKDTLSLELAKLKTVYLERAFDAEIKIDKESVYKKVITYVNNNRPGGNSILGRIKAKYDKIRNLEAGMAIWGRSKGLSSIPVTIYPDSVIALLKKDCRDSLNTACLDSAIRNQLAKDMENGANEIKALQVDIAKDITSLRQNTTELNKLQIGGEIKEFSEQVRAFKIIQPTVITITGSPQTEVSSNTASLSNFKMPSESEIIDAVAIYLAKRVKQEAVIYFVENLRNKIATTGLDTIFPETAKKFNAWKPYSAPNFDNSWRYAFSKDLVRLPRFGFKYLQINDNIIKPEFKAYLSYMDDALAISDKVIKHYNFIGIVESLADEPRKAVLLKSDGLRAFLRLTYIINQELYEVNEQKAYWIASDKFIKTMNNDEVMRIFFELLVKKHPDITNYLNIKLTNLQSDDLFKLKSWMSNVLLVLNHFQENQNQTIGGINEGFNINTYWSNLNEVINTVLSQQSGLAVISNSEKFTGGLEKVNELFEVYQLLQDKNYAAAANNCVGLMSKFVNDNSTGSEKFTNAAELVAFASEILQAQNKEQLSAAIESYALPPTSYRIKQNFSRVISVGAYFGPYAGAEFIRDTKAGGVVGFSAPLTLDFTFNKNHDTHRSYTTWSIMVFDLGSVVSYRLTHEGGALPEKARWSQLFSPGLGVRFGLGNTPLVFSLSGQLSPQLRDFNGGGAKDAIRVSAGLLIDMPLLLLHKK